MKTKSIIFLSYRRFFLAAFFLVCVTSLSAYAFEFVTEEDFTAEQSVYKDFPLKILFKKLQESDAEEKREIRNMIILKQVFDRKMQEKEKVGAVKYDKIFGVVKEIIGDDLKLWVPETDSYQSFYVGIDRLPVENENKYQLMESNIGRYAIAAYVMDGRIYKLEIDYLLAAPSRLSVKREGSENLLGWDVPETTEKPAGYKVFVNGKPFATVEDTVARVPRTEGRVDTYYVKAVYRQGKSYIDSDASGMLKDEITAKETEQKVLANKTYDRIIPLLNPKEWESGKKVLYENRQLLTDNLEGARKTNVTGLVDFFKDIDGGDQLASLTPVTLENMEKASALYQQAEKKANALPTEIGVLFVARSKIIENSSRKIPLLAEKNKQKQAEDTYNRIIAGLTPLEWEKAKKLLFDNQQTLSDFLDESRKANTTGLVEFFKDIDGGDHLGGQEPETSKNLELALSFYQRAEQTANSFPSGIDPSFIAQLKINEISTRMASLEKRNQIGVAKETYDKIILALNPSEWEKARNLLYENQPFLTDYLDEAKKSNMVSFIEFFRDIDGGDRLSAEQPETLRNLESALMFYQRADQKTKDFPGGVDMSFLSQLRMNQTADRIGLLERQSQAVVAVETARAEPQQVPISKTPDPETLDRKTALRWGIKEFKGKNYLSSLNFFERVYGSQIQSIKQGNQLTGLLSLPEKLRPLLIFLIEYEDVLARTGNDNSATIDEILQNIESGTGLWRGISEAKRNMIVKYISE